MQEILGRSPVIAVVMTLSTVAAGLAWPTAVFLPTPAQAAPIELVPETVNMFRDTRGANDVGIVQGDRFQFGANVVGGSDGTTLGAVYPPTGFTVSQFPCDPLAVNPNFCARTTSFDSNRLQPWTLRFENGPDVLTATGPSLVGSEQPVPFPTNVSFSGSGLTPTIAWTIPDGFEPDGFRVNVFDKGQITPNGVADIIHSVVLPESTLSYSLPSTLSSGQQLVAGENYTINFQLIETRNHVDLTQNADILRRSSSFFAFSPVTGSEPPVVFLPTVVDGVYNFSITDVGSSSIIFIDPFVAVGYDYAIGNSDPNFASVLLPDIGDDEFTLEYLDGDDLVQVMVAPDVQIFFPEGGVNAFSVIGIDPAAGLDPNNVTAFITGLTFVTEGNFGGTMTPRTVFVPEVNPVPEPASLTLVLIGLGGLAAIRWRKPRRTADV